MNQNIARMTIVTVIASSLLAFVPAPPAEAHHREKACCSEDICQTVFKIDGVRKFRLLMASRYFSSYDLCATHEGEEVCERRNTIRRKSGLYGDAVKYRDTLFPKDKGKYVITWRSIETGERFGKKLGFHVR